MKQVITWLGKPVKLICPAGQALPRKGGTRGRFWLFFMADGSDGFAQEKRRTCSSPSRRKTEMANTNVLTNMACPKCGQSGQFKIQVKTMATVVDSGVLETEDNEWSNDSYAQCDNEVDCDWTGTAGQLWMRHVVPE